MSNQQQKTLFQKFCETIEEHALWGKDEIVILAISGGADSLALLDLCMQYKQETNVIFIGACLDHGLRPESALEATTVQKRCQEYGIPCIIEKACLDVNSPGVEQQARDVRYHFLERVALQYNAKKIAVAHHADDQIETILFHFLKGTGIRGLSGMPYQRPLFYQSSILLIRPLLSITKSELQAYLQEKNITWFEDKSNSDTHYDRNHLRHEILPYLASHRYSYIKTSCLQIAKHAQEIMEYLENQANQWIEHNIQYKYSNIHELNLYFTSIFGKNNCIMIENNALNTLPKALFSFCLPKIMQLLSCNSSLRENHYQNFHKLQLQKVGELQFPDNIYLYKEKEVTYFLNKNCLNNFFLESKIFHSVQNLQDNAYLSCKKELWNKTKTISKSTLHIYMDIHNIHFPLQYRFIQKEDSIYPLGSPGVKKVSRILSDKKILSILRPFVSILIDSNGKGLWIPGLCIAEFVKIRPNTKECIAWNFTMRNA